MSQANVEIVRRSFDASNRRDLEALRALLDPNLEFDWSASRSLEAGVYRGIDAVLRFYTDSFDHFEEVLFEPDCFMDAGESVVVPFASRLRGREGIELGARSTLVYTVGNRRITRIRLYQETEEALQAVGLAE
jgi:ketosteroid isomerase-like protein